MSTEENKKKLRRILEEFHSEGQLHLADEIVAPTYFVHGIPGQPPGPEGLKQGSAWLHAGFPDLRFTVEDQIAEGEKVVTRWTLRGTHQGEFLGIAPTGKRATWTGVSIWRFAEGKAVEAWVEMDWLGLLQQLGAFPIPGEAGAKQ